MGDQSKKLIKTPRLSGLNDITINNKYPLLLIIQCLNHSTVHTILPPSARAAGERQLLTPRWGILNT